MKSLRVLAEPDSGRHSIERDWATCLQTVSSRATQRWPHARCAVAASLTLAGANAVAGPIAIPSDVSISLTANPRNNLTPGQVVAFTITATNNGPEPVTALPLISSDFVDEFDLQAGSSECPGIALLVTDGETFHYNFVWYPNDEGAIALGETRVCRINLPITSRAPNVLPFSFGMPSFVTDLHASNNTATVYLRRAFVATRSVPALSPIMLLLLATSLAGVAGLAHRHKSVSIRDR